MAIPQLSSAQLEAAREEGVTLLENHAPQALTGDGSVSGARLESGGKPVELAVDRVILALGQVPAPPPWLVAHGVKLDEAGRIVVDARGRTGHARLYAGGDNTRGPDLVVTAMAAGRLAAEGMLEAFSLGGRIREQSRRLLPAMPMRAKAA